MESEIGEDVVLSSYQSLRQLELNPTGKVWDVCSTSTSKFPGEVEGLLAREPQARRCRGGLAVRVRSAGSEIIKAEGM